MGIQMAAEDSVTDHFVKAACAVQDIQRHALLRTDRHGIDNGGTGVACLPAPLVVVQVEHIHSPQEVFLAVCDRNLKFVVYKNSIPQ